MKATFTATLLLAVLVAGCGHKAEAARRIQSMDAAAATRHAWATMERAYRARGDVRDASTAEAAAAQMDLCAFELERIALRLRETGPPPPGEQLDSALNAYEGLMGAGLRALGGALQTLGNEQVQHILAAADERLDAATERVQQALRAAPR